ncbi:MAG: hypothetical protein ACOY9Y_03205 [Bacillota bacterium]
MGNNSLLQELECLLAIDAFQSLSKSAVLKIGQLNVIIAILIKASIPFDLSFDPGNRRNAAAAKLSIFINPSTNLHFTISF